MTDPDRALASVVQRLYDAAWDQWGLLKGQAIRAGVWTALATAVISASGFHRWFALTLISVVGAMAVLKSRPYSRAVDVLQKLGKFKAINADAERLWYFWRTARLFSMGATVSHTLLFAATCDPEYLGVAIINATQLVALYCLTLRVRDRVEPEVRHSLDLSHSPA